MRLSEIIKYYSKPGLCEELVRFSENREVVAQFGTAFGKRPSILQFPSDVTTQVRLGATSFHCSEERWGNPLLLDLSMEKPALDKLRIGFDLVLDIDCRVLEWSKVCAKLLMQALKWHGVYSCSIKFSGGTGFHIGVPFEAFPTDEKIAFPNAPRAIASYLKEFIRNKLTEEILNLESDIRKISEKAAKPPLKLIRKGTFDPYSVLDIDTVLIASRHLFRAPYSLNEKRWLVSLPIKPKEIGEFDTSMAKPSEVESVGVRFLGEKAKKNEAAQLLTQAFDWEIRTQERLFEEPVFKQEYKSKVPTKAFPPCMKAVLQGLEDGRKRSLFALINLLKCIKWDWKEIESFVYEWNNKNLPPLKSGYVRSQLSWHSRQQRKLPPPNCREFYENFGICRPDAICGKIKNPVSYPRRKVKKAIKE